MALDGSVADAGLDVLPYEPPGDDLRLRSRDNVILTLHTAFYSEQSMLDLEAEASRQVALVLGGKQSEYVVDLDQLD